MLASVTARLRIVLVLAAARLLVAGAALARAAGGGGYSGGSPSGGGGSAGSGSAGGSSGGGGGFGLSDLVLVGAFIAFWIVAVARRGRRAQARRRAARESARQLTADLKDGERPFDADAFLARAELAFRKVQRAWSQQDLGPVRAFLSDGVHERFQVQLAEQRQLGYRNHLSGVAVHLAEIIEVRSGEHFDAVDVRITASATDSRVRLETLDEIQGSRRRERFVEVWSFLRAKGAAPEGGRGLIENACPNCGAPLGTGPGWRCDSCSGRLRVGPRDWVLAEITQRAEWRSGRGAVVAGAKDYRETDPGFTVQHLEDRASVIFWRKVESDRLGSARCLGSVARPEFLAEHARRLGAVDGERYFVGDCAVGSLDLHGVLPGEAWDRALVEVRWEGSVFDRAASDPPEDTRRRTVRRSLLVLARRAGTRSDLGRSVDSAHCPSCGAPDTGSEEGACSWCGTVLNDGQRDWLLEEVHPWHADEARVLRAEGAEPPDGPPHAPRLPGGTGLLAWAVQVSLADGRLARRERRGLARLASRVGVHPRRAGQLLEAGRRGNLEPELPASPEEAREWLAELARLAVAGGPLRAGEERPIRTLAGKAGIHAKELDSLLRQAF